MILSQQCLRVVAWFVLSQVGVCTRWQRYFGLVQFFHLHGSDHRKHRFVMCIHTRPVEQLAEVNSVQCAA